MLVKCKRCGRVWNYTGKKKTNSKYPEYITCTKCRTSVRLKKFEVKK